MAPTKPPKEFKYDVYTLIENVQHRPCLWNRTLDVYKDRFERHTAWEEIFRILEPKYDVLTPEECRLVGEQIMNKWTNIRDTFVKSLRPHPGKSKRKYILHDQMKFLCAIESYGGEQADLPDTSDYNPPPQELNTTVLKEETPTEEEVPVTNTKKRSRRSDKRDDQEQSCSYGPKKRSRKDTPPDDKDDDSSVNEIDFVEVGDIGEQRLMNEDEAFFASLLPTVVKYNEDERLEFRIDILRVMRKIQENRKWKA